MKNWNILIQHEGKEFEIIIQAPYYSDAFVNTELKYRNCVIKRISEIRETPEPT
jgi:hypothetical protein